MNSRNRLQATGGRRAGTSGFTLFAVLLAVAFMAGLVATYGRHVVVAGRGGMASPALTDSREACSSGLSIARQSIVSGGGATAGTIPAGDVATTYSVVSKPNGHQLVSVESMGGDGLGARRQAELAIRQSPNSVPSGPGSLPTLSASTVQAVLYDGTLARIPITTSQRMEHVEITGLLVVSPGVELQLADVVLHGAVISSSVLAQTVYGNYDAATAPRLLVDGNLRIDPVSALPGVAILMPEGAVTSSGVDARMQIHGDVVAHVVSLQHKGVLDGHVLGMQVTLADPALLDRLGFDRKPPEWSPALNLGGASETVYLATVPPTASLGSLSGIINYWKD